MHKDYGTDRWKIVCGNYTGTMRRAVDMLYAGAAPFTPYVMVAESAAQATQLDTYSLILVGTREDNPLIAQLVTAEEIPADGFLVRVIASPFGEGRQVALVVGSGEVQTIYAASHFVHQYLPIAQNRPYPYQHPPFFEAMPLYDVALSPSFAERGIWTWGYCIHDYRNFAQNMAKLGLNAITIWNDYAPLNAKEMVEYFHSYGIKVIFGYSWAWSEKPNITSEEDLAYWRQRVIDVYASQYESTGADGIYFQSFTETFDDNIGGVSIADTVVKWVNHIGGAMLSRWPDLYIQFGLHATSVKDRLDAIAKVDPRICITWEDCGAFPYEYNPSKTKDFQNTVDFTDKFMQLRPNTQTGVVLKGQYALDFTKFEFQKGPYIIGTKSKAYLMQRTEEKRKYMHYAQSYWLENLGLYRTTLKHLTGAAIYDLVEDSMFEETCWYSVALYALSMWYPDLTDAELLRLVAQRSDVTLA